MHSLLRCALIVLTCNPWAVFAQDLWVAAAISLKPALQVLGQRFEAEHPGAHVVFNYAASGVLVQQIARGAPADVLITADDDTMDRAIQKGLLVPTTRVVLATNRLILIAPRKALQPLQTLQDITSPAVQRIAVGQPKTVPAGRYTQQALERQGLWESLRPKWVWCESARQVLTYVVLGEVEAGFVYESDLSIEKDKVRLVAVVDTPTPVRYPMARTAASTQPDRANAFMAALRSPWAQAELARHGFRAP